MCRMYEQLKSALNHAIQGRARLHEIPHSVDWDGCYDEIQTCIDILRDEVYRMER